MKYTTVLGVDQNHLEHLAAVWPTWVRHKPGIMENPLIVFYDQATNMYREDFRTLPQVAATVNTHPNVTFVLWPPFGSAGYSGDGLTKWTNAQRHKMLAGFVHVPAMYVETDYWLKLDLDAVGHGYPNWVDPAWFDGDPAIIAHRWGYTKPADQMVKLDQWAAHNGLFKSTGPLNLVPQPGAVAVGHSRIISWCGFFNTDFSQVAARVAGKTCGANQIPVPSQDGFHWYTATRLNVRIRQVNMKSCGWVHCSGLRAVKAAAERALAE